MTLRSWKAAGLDEIPAEAIKADIEIAVMILYSLFSKIWEKEEVPDSGQKESSSSCQKKRRPEGLQLLSRDHAPVNARQGSQQGSVGEDEGGCQPQAPRPAGRLPAEQILCQPDRQPAHHHGTVTGVELSPLHQLHRLGEGLWQCRQRDNVEATETLWSPREDNLPFPVHLPGHKLQNCPRRPAV